MNRKDFLKIALAGVAAASVAPSLVAHAAGGRRKKAGKPSNLKISFQEGIAPGNSLPEKLDWMEANGVVGLEPWGGKLWERVDQIQGVLSGRNIHVSAICAGFSGFILAEDPAVKAEFDTSMRRIIEAAGALGSVGVIMVPAFNGQNPKMAHTIETRAFLVEQLAELGEFALKNNTTVILEPLNRREAFYLRLMSDVAAICKDTGSDGVRCLGDFWHMTWEETSDFGAFHSAGNYLNHVHIASRGGRKMPGEDGVVDNYVDGFRALQQIGYKGDVSFECGSRGDRLQTVPAALELIRSQWNQAGK